METKTGIEIRKAMSDICEDADDVLWISQFETVFDRLWTIYVEHEGNDIELQKQFPLNG